MTLLEVLCTCSLSVNWLGLADTPGTIFRVVGPARSCSREMPSITAPKPVKNAALKCRFMIKNPPLLLSRPDLEQRSVGWREPVTTVDLHRVGQRERLAWIEHSAGNLGAHHRTHVY